MKVFVYVCGILTFPGESENWTGKAVTWTHLNTQFHAEKVEYFTGPISRVMGQQKRAIKLSKTMAYYMNRRWEIVLCAHSNGCDVVLRAMNHLLWPKAVSEIHLISGACEADFPKNGLTNFAGKVVTYTALQDRALSLADTFIGNWFGYGVLGKVGPQNTQGVNLYQIIRNWGHSDWFRVENFDETMELVIGRTIHMSHSHRETDAEYGERH